MPEDPAMLILPGFIIDWDWAIEDMLPIEDILADIPEWLAIACMFMEFTEQLTLDELTLETFGLTMLEFT